MNASHSDAFLASVGQNIDVAALGERLVVLGDLITLRQVRVEVVLAGKT
jgi:hypothetical protein